MRRFDGRSLYQALDQQRRERALSWDAVAREIGVSKSTILRTKSGGRMTVCWRWWRGSEYQWRDLYVMELSRQIDSGFTFATIVKDVHHVSRASDDQRVS
jgi:hypothetical protein